MIKKYIIDGNNLIWKIPDLAKLIKNNPRKSREKLVFKLERYFNNKKFNVSLHLDGFPGEVIKTSKIKIIYSFNKKADDLIRDEIDAYDRPEFICVVSSDNEILKYSRANACATLKANEFLKLIEKKETLSEEEKIQKEIDNEEILKLFLKKDT